MTTLPLTLAAATALLAPLREAIAAGRLDAAVADRIRTLGAELDAAVRTERVDHGDVQRGLIEALDFGAEHPQTLGYAINGIEYVVRAATDGTIERNWHPATPGYTDEVGQLGFDWGYWSPGWKHWNGGFADEAAARAAYVASR